MFETVVTFKSKSALLKCHSKFSPALAQRVSCNPPAGGGADHHLVRYWRKPLARRVTRPRTTCFSTELFPPAPSVSLTMLCWQLVVENFPTISR